MLYAIDENVVLVTKTSCVRKLSMYNCVHFAHFLKVTCIESVLPQKSDMTDILFDIVKDVPTGATGHTLTYCKEIMLTILCVFLFYLLWVSSEC